MSTLSQQSEFESTCTFPPKRIGIENFTSTQFMDKMMLEKIKTNNPHHEILPFEDYKLELYLSLAYSLMVKEEWFSDNELIDSIHGLRHLQRSSYFAFILAKQLHLNNKQVLCAVIAALLHDIRRPNCNEQMERTSLSAEWFDENASIIASDWG